MDDIVPVMENIVKVEMECKEEPEDSLDSGDEELMNIDMHKDDVIFAPIVSKCEEEEEEIKRPVAVFVQSNDGYEYDYFADGKEICEKDPLDHKEDILTPGVGSASESTVKDFFSNKKNKTIFKIKSIVWEWNRRLLCHKCGKRVTDLNDHMNRCHTRNGRTYECNLCKKRLKSELGLNIHMHTHTPRREYQCEICRKVCKSSATFDLHKKFHTEDGAHHCSLCNKNCLTKEDLSLHWQSHPEMKPFQCDTCQEGFTKEIYLSIHRETHKAVCGYPCDICMKTFTQKQQMVIHRRTHTGEKLYKCGICQKGFNTRSDCTRHEKIHRKKGAR